MLLRGFARPFEAELIRCGRVRCATSKVSVQSYIRRMRHVQVVAADVGGDDQLRQCWLGHRSSVPVIAMTASIPDRETWVSP